MDKIEAALRIEAQANWVRYLVDATSDEVAKPELSRIAAALDVIVDALRKPQ